ncbi:hypothetical protein WJ97_12705 [Burkholderia ubonensis]|uniref:hypothetical protein n=1 Tax=Burkholderia ubonensis TaxID=101571 RepID=UPI00075260DC|nr:hypothetical protein [Burkholderia ubonensis]KVP96734.1 hypothetical protein WJ97_12705 [Burkholderia ubonensis]
MTQHTLPTAGTPLDKPGYHLVAIPRGELGELSKIQEELDELRDAMAQGSRVMAAVELSDMVGAIQAFMDRHLPGMTIEDLLTFSNITKRAFVNGRRSSN